MKDKLNSLFNFIGSGGMKHIIISAIITVVAKWLLPVWVAVLVASTRDLL